MAATTSQTPHSLLSESSESPSIDFLQLSSCEDHCDKRRAELKADEEAIIESRGSIINSQKELVRTGLCNMKKELKKMTVKEFNATFGCDVIGTLRSQLEMTEDQGSEMKRVGTTGGLNLKTPAVKFAGRPPMTAARTVRKGERVVSVNGSPVDQFDKDEIFITAKKRRAVNNKESNTPFPISIGVGVGNGESIDLSDPNQRKNMDEEQKAQALEQVMAMQEQMKNLMANW